MPKSSRQQRSVAQPAQRFDFTVKTIRAHLDGEFVDEGQFNCADIRDAKDAADRLQREFDFDSEPCRVYVYRLGEVAPIYAGSQRSEYGGYRG